MKKLSIVLAVLALAACDHYEPIPVSPDNGDRIGILITGWGEPKGYDHDFRLGLWRAQVGLRKTSPDQKCTEHFAGTWPYVTQVGLVPFAVGHPVERLEAAYDAMGIYRLRGDGDYESIVDPSVILKAADIPDVDGMIQPVTESDFWPSRSIGPIDPRDGAELLPDTFQIGMASRKPGDNPLAFPNGISDFDEQRIAASMVDMKFMYEWMLPRPNIADRKMDEKTREVLHELFGDQIEIRFGAYSKTPGITELEDDVAVEFVNAGFKQLILTRETTDNNQYANQFMTFGNVWHRLCTEGLHRRAAIKQTRQVGRTPEYNTALNNILGRHLGYHPKGSEVTLIYTTYGMPFPGSNDKGPFAVAHPLAAETYHENAYLNYQSYKRYAQAAFGDDWELVFNHRGQSGDDRTASYYAYAMFPTQFYGQPDDPLRYPTIRENIDKAKADGRKQIIVLLSHWNYNNTDNMLGMRNINQIPFNSRWDRRLQKFWRGWCERVDSFEEVPCDEDGIVRLTITETFDNEADAFGIAYGQRIRGTVEQFGLLPDGVEIVTSDEISVEDGGRLKVTDGELAGVELVIAPDPEPGKPESFRWNNYEAFVSPDKLYTSAWFDFDAYIATQPVAEALSAALVGPPVLIGPYRTIVNAPARVTLPYDPTQMPDGSTVQPMIYNDVNQDWDPVYDVAGGAATTVAEETVSFDTQVLGLFGLRRATP